MAMRIATAEWADPAEVEQRYLYRDGTVWLGRSASENQAPLGYKDDRHVCLVGGSRGGKGTTGIVPTLITWPGSICVLDPKGENATITAARRAQGSKYCEGMGQTVRVVDPFKAAQIDDALRGCFNPLDALDPQNPETIDEAGRIADAVVVIHESSNDPFWDESARAMVKGLILHVLTAPTYEGRRSLVTLRKLITRGDWESVEALRASGDKNIPPAHGLLWRGLANNQAFDGLVAGIGESFTNMLLNSPKQYESVLQVANRNTEFIDSPAMQACLEASDFQLAELKTRPEGLSLYLCLPQRYMSTHFRWLRMMISLTVTEMEKVRGRPATGYPILLLLDEFAGLKRMEVVENAVAQIAGYGVKMFFVLQSLEQLKAVYKDNWETFLANSGLRVFFNLEDNFSREYVSKLIGETEVIREVRSSNESTTESEGTSRSTTISESQTKGRSRSTGISDSEGTNRSTNTGTSGGVNTSRSTGKSTSTGMNWTPEYFLWFEVNNPKEFTRSRGESSSTSETQGESKGWSQGQSQGVSSSTSRSVTDGESESWTKGTSETEGTTQGTSKSQTSGTSENIQKRALVTPDEIGQLFARVDDRGRAAYPGLALVVISGARPVAVRRVNYYEDYQFLGLFDPHPDHPFAMWRELSVEGSQLGFALADYGLSLGRWSISIKQIAAGGNEAVAVLKDGGAAPAAWIRVPRLGVIRTVPAAGQTQLPPGPVFSLRHYDDGAPLIDPFAEIRALIAAPPKALTAQKKSLPLGVVAAVAGVLILIAVLAIATVRDRVQSGVELVPDTPSSQVRSEPGAQSNRASNEVTSQPGQPSISDPRVTWTLAYTLQHPTQYGQLMVSFSPDGRLLASGDVTQDMIKLWDIASRSELRTINVGDKPWLHFVAFSPDSRLLVTGDQAAIKGWDVSTGAEVRRIEVPLYVMTLGPDGQYIAAGCQDATVRFWKAATGAELGGYPPAAHTESAMAFGPGGVMLAVGHTDNSLHLWDVASGKELRILSQGDSGGDSVSSVAFSPDGTLLASSSSDKTIALWDPANGTELRRLRGPTDFVTAVAFSPDGRLLASASADKTVRLWNPRTGKELAASTGQKSVAFSPDGSFLATGGEQIRIFKITVEK